MARQFICDVCHKPTEKLAGKLFFSPILPGGTRKSGHNSHYTHRADVGVCCWPKMTQLFNFTPRGTQEEYYGRGTNGTVEKGTGGKAKVSGSGKEDSEKSRGEEAA